MMRRLLILLLPCLLAWSADPYDAWAQGRPADAVDPLIATAAATQRWDAWLDAGLAAAAAGRTGTAVACCAAAHHAAPERAEPRDALRALGAQLPTTWCERTGPVAMPGTGWIGVAVLLIAGTLIGLGLSVRRIRTPSLVCGAGLLVLAAPGLIAPWLDRQQVWVTPVRDTQALDSTGAPQRALVAGTLLRSAGRAWGQRQAVILADGQTAWVPESDLDPAR